MPVVRFTQLQCCTSLGTLVSISLARRPKYRYTYHHGHNCTAGIRISENINLWQFEGGENLTNYRNVIPVHSF